MPSGRARFIENHDFRYKGRDVSDVRQPTIDGELGKIFGRVTRIIGLVIILREKVQESFVIWSVAALQ